MIRRRAVLVALVTALAAVTTARGEGGAASPGGRDKCVKNARTSRNECMRDATEHCNRAFDGDLQACFGADNTCIRGCINGHARCLEEPQGAREGCRMACGADQKVALRDCKVQVDLRGCQDTAKRKGLECKQGCTAKAAPAKQRCGDAFNSCITGCSG